MTSVVLPLFLLVLVVLSVSADKRATDPEKKAPDYIYKGAAQICGSYFKHCRENAENKPMISECFKNIYYQCLPQLRKMMEAIQTCVEEAGDDFEAVKNCYSDGQTA